MKRLVPVPAAATLALLGVSAAAAPKPAAKPAAKPTAKPAAALTPTAVIARLVKDEARVTSGRLSIHFAERRAELAEGTKPAAVRGEMEKTPIASQRRDYLLFSGKTWKRDATFMDAQGDTSAHLVVGVDGKGVGRALQEMGRAETMQRAATIGDQPEQTAADRLLVMRSADLLEGYEWKSAKAAAGTITLTGTRGIDKVTAIVRTTPRYALEKLTMGGKLETPQGEVNRGQEIKATYTIGKAGLELKGIEHFTYFTGALNRGFLNKYKIEGTQLNVPIRPDELAVSIPEGTPVSDARVDPPVRYKQGSQELTEVQLQELQANQGAKQAQVNKPAPEFELKTLDGKSAKLSDQKGKVVLLTWFASWCGPCHAEAPQMEKEIWQKYRERGLVVYGVNAGERMTPHEMARGFVQQHSLTYPVLMDVDSEASELFAIRAFPTLAVIDRKGVLRYLQAGFNKAAVLQQVEALLAEQP